MENKIFALRHSHEFDHWTVFVYLSQRVNVLTVHTTLTLPYRYLAAGTPAHRGSLSMCLYDSVALCSWMCFLF